MTTEAVRGFFVTFEGGEGAGKTTQIERLAITLRATGRAVVVTREPGGTPGADAVRALILSGAAQRLGCDAEAVLFAAARLDHVAQVIRPALERGAIVLCDRFHDSTRVYQGSAPDADPEFLRILEGAVLDEVWPDLTLILDIPASTGLQRATDRRGRDAAPDRYERETIEIHEARRQAFLRIAALEPERCIVIDADRSADAVTADIVSAAVERLALADARSEERR